jgi:O-succinylbenzoate synthase
MLALESRMIVNLKPGRVGGLSQAVAIHDMCARAGVRLWCGGMLESGVGRAYNVALASLPHFTEPGDLSPSDRYWERDVVRPPWAMDSAGRVRVPLDRPGLGVEVDVGYVDDVTVRVAELSQH